ncbi:MAG: hypothetical protein QXP31_04945 [Pyrobaculum sp.]
MKLSRGLLWGLVVGLAVGLVVAVISYMGLMEVWDAYLNYIYQVVYSTMVKTGVTPAEAERSAQLAVNITKQWLIPSIVIGAVALFIIIFIVLGVVMAATWERLKMMWYGKGALFAVALLMILDLPRLLVTPPPDLPRPPTPSVIYSVLEAVAHFVGPLALAWLLNKAK